MIPEEHRSAIIQDGICFIQSITKCYGSETGMELWDKIAEVLDPSVKGDIFFAMITGEIGDKLRVSISLWNKQNTYPVHKVSMIKAVRQASGLDLKSAKDLVERLADKPGVREDIIIPDRAQYAACKQELINAGFTV